MHITFGQKTGTVEVQLGRTRVLAAVTGDIVPPFPDRPNEVIHPSPSNQRSNHSLCSCLLIWTWGVGCVCACMWCCAQGFLNFYADFSPMASPHFQPDRPSDKSIELARVVERGIRESRALDTEALCILAGQKVWSVRCDMHIIDHEGNLVLPRACACALRSLAL